MSMCNAFELITFRYGKVLAAFISYICCDSAEGAEPHTAWEGACSTRCAFPYLTYSIQ